jgi:hypothetical protein
MATSTATTTPSTTADVTMPRLSDSMDEGTVVRSVVGASGGG